MSIGIEPDRGWGYHMGMMRLHAGLRGIALAALITPLFPAVAEGPSIDFSGNIRLRQEAIDNQARAGVVKDETLTNIRTILNANAGQGPVKLGATLIDSRIYDAGPRTGATSNEVDALELVQAWVALDLGAALGRGTALKL